MASYIMSGKSPLIKMAETIELTALQLWAIAHRIDAAIAISRSLDCKLIRVVRPSK